MIYVINNKNVAVLFVEQSMLTWLQIANSNVCCWWLLSQQLFQKRCFVVASEISVYFVAISLFYHIVIIIYVLFRSRENNHESNIRFIFCSRHETTTNSKFCHSVEKICLRWKFKKKFRKRRRHLIFKTRLFIKSMNVDDKNVNRNDKKQNMI